MKVILKEDVEELGLMGETLNVSDGYGRNYLIPKKLAIPASKVNIKTVEHEKKIIATKKEKIISHFNEVKSKIDNITINLAVKTGENDKIFGSITKSDIEEELKKSISAAGLSGVEIDKKTILLDNPIKELGVQTVKVKLHPEVFGEIKVNVIPEKAE